MTDNENVVAKALPGLRSQDGLTGQSGTGTSVTLVPEANSAKVFALSSRVKNPKCVIWCRIQNFGPQECAVNGLHFGLRLRDEYTFRIQDESSVLCFWIVQIGGVHPRQRALGGQRGFCSGVIV